jgi:serine/threonine protein kinase
MTSSKRECLYLISPQAIMDMKTWLDEPPAHWRDRDPDYIRWHIHFDAMLGLATGLTWIHREIGGQVGYHRDIKPSNLLLFEESGQGLVWKICDFGSSNLKAVEDTKTANPITTHYWAPPEYFADNGGINRKKHGRTHDVFSMGCVFLSLTTILHKGWSPEGLDKFKENRMSQRKAQEDSSDSYMSHAFHNNMQAVLDWVAHLQKTARREPDKQVLGLIEEMLRPIDQRVFSWEVEIDLFILLDSSRHPDEVTERLGKAVQPSRGFNVRAHNPYSRAKAQAQLERGKTKKRSPEFFEVLEMAGWREYSPQSTSDFLKPTMPVQNPLSTIPISRQKGDEIRGRQNLYAQISDGFKESDAVVLYGMAGVG